VRKPVLRISFALLGVIVIGSVLTWPKPAKLAGAQLLSGARVSPQVLATLKRSCGDCHSEATHYPWYSYVFPVSWLIQSDVTSGREHLNLSRWEQYSAIRRQRRLSEIANQVQDGGMPLFQYTLIHRNARLSREDVAAIFQWTQEERSRIIAETVAR
jgi:hypothetical protein